MRCFVALALAVAGCGPGNGSTPDLAIAVDAAVAPDLAQDQVACEGALLADWAANLPSLGMADDPSAGSYGQVIGSLMKKYDVPGGAVAVTHDGRLVFAKSWGFSDRDAPDLAHPDDLFRVASVSKQLTSAEILALVEQGKLSLDDKAFDLLSDIQPLPNTTKNPQLAQITVRNLLQHTGGWNRGATYDPMFISPTVAAALSEPGPASCTDIIRYMLDKPLTHAPGSTYCYSNFGYCVLGRVIEKVTGQPYDASVKSTILAPATVTRTIQGHTLLPLRADGEVLYYTFQGAGLADSVFPTMPGKVPWPYGGWNLEAMDSHGAWIASTIDLLRFQTAIDGRRGTPLLTNASITTMLDNPNVPSCNDDGSTTPADPNYWYGFGWQVNSSANWWHTGSLDGTATEVVRAANGYGWAAFFNTRPQDAAFFGDLDSQLWVALNGSSSFLNDDLFDQYGAFSNWMSDTDYASAVAAAKQNGQFVSRVEGRLNSGAAQYRAQFVPLHNGRTAQSDVGLLCSDYRDEQTRYSQMGYRAINLQSYKAADGLRRFQAAWENFQ